MKKVVLVFIVLLVSVNLFAQGKNISWKKKSKQPYITYAGDTISIKQDILLLEGSSEDGDFKYVQVINNFNEPLRQATSRVAFQKQPVKFFKEQNGNYYAFTKYFCINIEAALRKSEIEIFKKKE